MSREYEAERTMSREEVATALRRLADGVATGRVRVDADEGPVEVTVPADLEFEVELEEGDGEVELEAELEWPAPADVESVVESLDPDGDDAPFEESPAGPATQSDSKARFELFKDAAGEWRWRLRHRNGNVIADGGEGYARKQDAVNGIESVKSNAPLAAIEDEEA